MICPMCPHCLGEMHRRPNIIGRVRLNVYAKYECLRCRHVIAKWLCRYHLNEAPTEQDKPTGASIFEAPTKSTTAADHYPG